MRIDTFMKCMECAVAFPLLGLRPPPGRSPGTVPGGSAKKRVKVALAEHMAEHIGTIRVGDPVMAAQALPVLESQYAALPLPEHVLDSLLHATQEPPVRRPNLLAGVETFGAVSGRTSPISEHLVRV